MRSLLHLALAIICASTACGGGGSASSTNGGTSKAPSTAPSAAPGNCVRAGTAAPTATPQGQAPQPATGLSVPPGFQIQVIAKVSGARELAFSPNGDLFAGTTGSSVYVIDNAEGQAASAHVFADLGDAPAAGVTVSLTNCSLYVGTQSAVYRIPYTIGDQTAQSSPIKIAGVRPGGGSGHSTTTVAVSGDTLYASVGSSCNACSESDPTRAAIEQMHLDGSGMTPKAIHIRNAIALTTNPATGTVWAGDAGQDYLPQGHPYEFFDAVTLHAGVADYGWPQCEENHISYRPGANCGNEVVPLVEFPAYETFIGATFYEPPANAAHAFPAQYQGGAFVTLHGSWHTGSSGMYIEPPRVAFVAMSGDTPRTSVNWSNPTTQWTDFITGFQTPSGSRIGRPTGIAVGPDGDLFVADDQTGAIYRIRH